MSLQNAIAYLDEAGEKGFVRNLSADRDDKIGLLCSLVFPADRIEEYRSAFDKPFGRFKAEGDGRFNKLHITEAFRPGNEDLRPMACEVRQEIFDLIRAKTVPVIYDARRMGLSRLAYESLHALKQEAVKNRRNTAIAIPNRPEGYRVEHHLIEGLALKLDAFSIDADLNQIDLLTDQIDLPVAAGLEESIDRTRFISKSTKIVKAYDLRTKERVQGQISISVNAPFELDVKHVGSFTVIDKDDPLIFATDVVTNALYDHLSTLSPSAALNAPSSIQNFVLHDRVWGVLDDAIEDCL